MGLNGWSLLQLGSLYVSLRHYLDTRKRTGDLPGEARSPRHLHV